MLINMIGQIKKIHSDFYYVSSNEALGEPKDDFECKLREILKKQKAKIVVGDFVEFTPEGAIYKLLKRKNFCPRPSVANLDLIIVVSSIYDPDLDFNQLNRYLTFLKYYKIPALLCFNKDDLANKESLEEFKNKIEEIYAPLGYKTIFTSALSKDGLDELKEEIRGKLTAFCGLSGVGKSSMLNALNPKLNLRTKNVSDKLKRGTHTTRHSEIIDFGEFKVADTPGFSRLTFDFLLPSELGDLFDEIKNLKEGCKYRNCLHTKESTNCNVIKNLENIDITRYNSYIEFLEEAKKYKEKVTCDGTKTESSTKTIHSETGKREIAKIGAKKRTDSRKKTRQLTKNILNTIGEDDD